ncbi:hypothetical protein KKD03_00710 [Patescibacteria group bacterium]|nr:hypothetical protein [Patescibacteria group bacterium]
MQDQNTQNSKPQVKADDFYKDIDDLVVSEDNLRTMAAITQVQVESADNAGELVEKMEELVEEENSLEQ